MTDNSDNSFNTNSYRKKVSLEDIDRFIYDIQNDTDNIVRDFHKNKAVMKTYFSDIITNYPDNEECILLLVYLVLSMRTKLIGVDKKIEEYSNEIYPDYAMNNVSENVVKIIQSYTHYINKKTWFKL